MGEWETIGADLDSQTKDYLTGVMNLGYFMESVPEEMDRLHRDGKTPAVVYFNIENFKAYIQGFSDNIKDILNNLDMETHIKKMDEGGCLFNTVKAFSELDLSVESFDSIKMGYIFENLIGRFFQNVDAGQFYTGRDIVKLGVSLLVSEGCDDIFDDHKLITICDQAAGTGGML